MFNQTPRLHLECELEQFIHLVILQVLPVKYKIDLISTNNRLFLEKDVVKDFKTEFIVLRHMTYRDRDT